MFGNPTTAGIALNFEVDMSPYQQEKKDAIMAARAKKAAEAKKKREQADLLKGVVYDDSKIHARRRDSARNEYGSTITDLIDLQKRGDMSGVYDRIAKFKSRMNDLVDENTQFKAYRGADQTKNWINSEYGADFDNLDITDDQLVEKYGRDTVYNKETGTFHPNVMPKYGIEGIGKNKLEDRQSVYAQDDKGRAVREMTLPTGEVVYKTTKDEDSTLIEETAVEYLAQGGELAANHLMHKYGINPENIDGSVLMDLARKEASEYYSGKLYGQKTGKYPKTTGKAAPAANESDVASWNMSEGGSPYFFQRELPGPSGGEDKKLSPQRNYDVTITKGTGKESLTIPPNAYQVDTGSGELTKIDTKSPVVLFDAIPVQASAMDDGKIWYTVVSSGDSEEAQKKVQSIYEAIMEEKDPEKKKSLTRELQKSRYALTYLMEANETNRNQFWQAAGVSDKNKMKELEAELIKGSNTVFDATNY